MTAPAQPDAARLAALAREMLAAALPCRHGPDFSSVWWYGTYYVFTAAQAKIVAVLWESWLNGTPEVRQETLLEAAGTEGRRLASLFQEHPAWGVMIVPGPVRGLFRLAEPEKL